jgi:ABC-type cobalamin transport system permease subunit
MLLVGAAADTHHLHSTTSMQQRKQHYWSESKLQMLRQSSCLMWLHAHTSYTAQHGNLQLPKQQLVKSRRLAVAAAVRLIGAAADTRHLQ